MSLIFATGNIHKIEEASEILKIQILPATKEWLMNTPEETGKSFEENALIKAKYIFDTTGYACFAEDSGLCVEALNGTPGIYSARFAGENATDVANNLLLLDKLKGREDRRAYFCAIICYIDAQGYSFFEGRIYGKIAVEISGKTGFGYDPLFIPDGYDSTFAELGKTIKNSISHRKMALEKFKEFLNSNSLKQA
ncbi:MAG: RdgB/HAM1 family non-canonical purine NTP pyrophosphatase [Bacteroidetes bacterium]|nr:RdgB/HAM1 family non-canonical purine NTP pyrophosphatase [Bacteroidota bacterium]